MYDTLLCLVPSTYLVSEHKIVGICCNRIDICYTVLSDPKAYINNIY